MTKSSVFMNQTQAPFSVDAVQRRRLARRRATLPLAAAILVYMQLLDSRGGPIAARRPSPAPCDDTVVELVRRGARQLHLADDVRRSFAVQPTFFGEARARLLSEQPVSRTRHGNG
eukprot:COSAG04_NODE_4318_length_2159_cov_802.681068_3_plen_116_part_00